MIRDRGNCFFLLLILIILCSLSPRFSVAQTHNTSTDTCETYARCGAFGSCNAQDSPICTCLKGFGPNNEQEWASGNWTSGCVRRVPLSSCEGDKSGEDGFLKLQMMKISGYSIRWAGPKSECEGRCLRNCSCIAYAFDAGIGCMFWIGTTLMDTQKFPGSGSGSDLYIRVANSELSKFIYEFLEFHFIVFVLITV